MTRRQALERTLRARELAGDGRAGSFARARARRAQREFARRQWLLLSVGWLVLVSPVPLAWWFLPNQFLRGVLVGTTVTAATAAVWFLVVQSTGTAPIMMGDQAEQWTAHALRQLGRGWRVVNRFMLSSHGDVDHLAVGPAGLLVVETKWSAYPWHSGEGVERSRAAVGQVQRVTRQLSLWTEIKKSSVRATPVVVVWGGGGWDDTNRVRVVDGVAVVEGNTFSQWARELPADPASSPTTTQTVWDALDKQARLRDGHDPAALAVPMSVGDVVTQLGLFVAAAVLSFFAFAGVLNATGSAVVTGFCGATASVLLVAAYRRWRAARAPVLGALVGIGLPTVFIAVVYAAALIV